MNGAGTWASHSIGSATRGDFMAADRVAGCAPPPNPRSSRSHSRDYGVLVTNPSPNSQEKEESPRKNHGPQRGSVQAQYKVLIHEWKEISTRKNLRTRSGKHFDFEVNEHKHRDQKSFARPIERPPTKLSIIFSIVVGVFHDPCPVRLGENLDPEDNCRNFMS